MLVRLSDIASGTIGDFIQVDDDGRTYRIDLKKARRLNKLHLIKSLKPTQHGIGVELYDAQAALETLARYHSLFDRTRATGESETSRPRIIIPRTDDDRFEGPPG